MKDLFFSSERLIVRELRLSDIEDFYDMQSNPNVMRFIKPHMDYQQSEQELLRFISYYSDPAQSFKIGAAIDKNSEQFIGMCGLYSNDKSEQEVAYRLRECFWGVGYGREMAKGTQAFAFEELAISELIAYVHQENTGSIKILESEMDFIEEFTCEKNQVRERKYSMKIADWKGSQSAR